MAPTPTTATQGAHASDSGTRPARFWWTGMSWWPLLCVPAAVALTLVAKHQGWQALLLKTNHEVIAPPLLAVTTLLLLRTWIARRETLMAALTVLAAAFLCREIHFEGSNGLVYLTILFVLIWVWRRWSAMRATLLAWPSRGWMVASFSAYILSQVVARRAFRALPGETGWHVPMEELLESAAHLLFLYAALCSNRRSGERAEA